ncbi:hypothetical protein BD779DRAFT_1679466 [Infundibulicybe gibba]|nr:hypothetical protein BD779DRAFT_1679466 [Infundibulicybe gibba]
MAFQYDPSVWDDMPPAVEQGGGGGFIPPPPGATQGGQPIGYDPFPGANHAATNPYPSSSPWGATNQHQLPQWVGQSAGGPAVASGWTFGQYPQSTPAWVAGAPPTPGATWEQHTPGSWGPPTPASAHQAEQPRWMLQGATNGAESAFGQAISASPWFGGGGGGGGGGELGGYDEIRGVMKKKKKKKKQDTHSWPGEAGALALGRPLSRTGTPHPHGHLALHHPVADHYPLARYGPSSIPAYRPGRSSPYTTPPDVFDERNLSRRPRDWRADYSPRSSLSAYIPWMGKGRSDVKEISDPIRRTPDSLILYSSHYPPIYYDLRFDVSYVEFLTIKRPVNDLDFAQLATQPAAESMRLYHAKLPWYIDIVQSHPNGVMVRDVMEQMYEQLQVPISGRHFWNEELGDDERRVIGRAFQDRCAAVGDESDMARGVRKVDFLGAKVVFQGLVRGRNGMWEMKMTEAD